MQRTPENERISLAKRLARIRASAPTVAPPPVEGVLTRMVGLTLEAVGCQAPIGARCDIMTPDNERVETEVVGFSGDRLYLMPTGDIHGLVPNARVIPTDRTYEAPVSHRLLGRVLDGDGRPLDGRPPVKNADTVPLQGRLINPL